MAKNNTMTPQTAPQTRDERIAEVNNQMVELMKMAMSTAFYDPDDTRREKAYHMCNRLKEMYTDMK